MLKNVLLLSIGTMAFVTLHDEIDTYCISSLILIARDNAEF